MIFVFCGQKGSGKTKNLIKLANDKVDTCAGNIVYIDDDWRVNYELKSEIRFISTEEYEIEDYSSFYGFLCGILSEDYDIKCIFIDGLLNIVKMSLQNAAHLFSKIDKLCKKYNVDFYINISEEKQELPEFLNKYVV